jgi:hypothetical protein
VGTSIGACPLRKVTGHRRTVKTVDDHLNTLKEYLYEEGPQTTARLTEVLGLAESRTIDILGQGRHEGLFTTFNRGTTTYWMLDESH